VTINLLLLIVAVLCFLAVGVFITDMHGADEPLRVIAFGLAAFAGAHIGWTNRSIG
jgi:hypothetical protein